MIPKTLLAVCVVAACAAASASTYYVSPSGDDRNSGTSEAQPFRVVQHAIDRMAPGDTLVVMDGVYVGEVKLKSGIAIRAQNPRKAVFSGVEPLNARFERHAGNIYKTKISGSPKQLFFNDQPMHWARWPNAAWAENWMAEKKWAKATEGTGPGVLTSDAFAEVKDFDLTGAYCFLRYGKGNSCYSRLIESFDGTTLHWNDDDFYSSKYTGEDGRKGSAEVLKDPNFASRSARFGIHPKNSKFFLAGSLDLLDAPGEWFAKDGFLYLYPFDGEDPNEASILIKTTDFCLDEGEPVSGVTVEGIDFLGCSVRLANRENADIAFENCQFKYGGAELLYVDRVQGWGGTDKPVEIAGSNIRIERCLFAGAQNTGLKLIGSDLLLRNSVFMENNRGSMQGNLIGQRRDIFTNGELSGLTLIPIDPVVKEGVSQTDELAAQGVKALDSFRGAYDVGGEYWYPGSDWMPNGLPVLKTMAEAERFAKKYRTISIVPEMGVKGLASGHLSANGR